MTIATSPETRNLWSALRKARKAVGAITRNAYNEETHSNYASLDHILEMIETAMDEQDLILIPTPAQEGRNHGVQMRLQHVTSGEWLDAVCLFPLGEHPTAHQVLASQTYGRRAIIQSVLNLRVRDDDGNAASGLRQHDDTDAPWATGAPSGRTTGRTLADPAPAPVLAEPMVSSPVTVGTQAHVAAPDTAAVGPGTSQAEPTLPAAAAAPDASPGGATAPSEGVQAPTVESPAASSGRRRTRGFAPETMVAEARSLKDRLTAILGEEAARKFVSARIPGCFLGSAHVTKVREFITDATAFLVSQGQLAGQPVAEPSEVPAPAA